MVALLILAMAVTALTVAALVSAGKAYDDAMRRHGDWDGEG